VPPLTHQRLNDTFEEKSMLKNSFLGRRDEPQTPASNARATPDSPRYAPQPDAPPLSAVAVTTASSSSARPAEQKPGSPAAPLTTATTAATAGGGNGVAHADLISSRDLAVNAGNSSGAPRLTVGPNIKLKGAEINDCDTLVVEGHVEASMDSKTLEILKTGSYEGTVTIDVAEIHGKFQGNLTARKKLIVHASGVVAGTVRYGSLLVSEGGVVSGDIASIDGKGENQSNLFAGYPSARNTAGVGKGIETHGTA